MPRLDALQERAKDHAQMLVTWANSDATEAQQLQRYLKAWCDSGHDLRQIEVVRSELDECLKHWQRFLLPAGIEEINEPIPVMRPGTRIQPSPLTPVKTHGKPILVDALVNDSINPANFAALEFCRFITGLYAENVIVCERCGRFHLNTGGHWNKRYCSRKCAVTNSVKRQREREQQEKRRRALKAFKRFTQLKPTAKNWKHWVAKEAKVSPRWLTRSINSKRLPRSPDELIAHSESKKKAGKNVQQGGKK